MIRYFSVNGAGGGGGGAMPVNTANGISGDGSVATPVILGGVLNQDTNIDISTFQFQLGNIGGDGPTIQMDQSDGLFIFYQDSVVGFGQLDVTVNPGIFIGVHLAYIDTSSNSKEITISSNAASGLEVQDNIDSIGLIGDRLFPVSGPNQYAQYGNIPALAAQVDLHNQTITQVVPLYNLPVGNNQVLQINPFLFANAAGAGNINMNLTYTDVAGTAVSIAVGALIGVTSMETKSYTINALAGSPVALSVVVSSPGFDYNIGAAVSLLFNN